MSTVKPPLTLPLMRPVMVALACRASSSSSHTRHDAFGLEAGVDHHDIAANFYDGTDDDGARLQLGQIGLALFKQFGK
jgi:hypothetical protein